MLFQFATDYNKGMLYPHWSLIRSKIHNRESPRISPGLEKRDLILYSDDVKVLAENTDKIP
jgi:hypothetical protein